MDALLHRYSLGPGTLCLLGGRMHTRKTAVMMNLVANLLEAQVPVGLVGLDEAPHMYTAKLASVISGVSHSELEEAWDSPDTKEAQGQYMEATSGLLSVSRGTRPSFADLNSWLEMCEVTAARPRVVFIDYLSLLARAKYTKGEAERILRLTEDLQVWTADNEVVTIALHQVGRTDEGANRRYHGDQPLTAEQLKYGGEEMADLVFGTFRPALNPIGNMSWDQADAEGIDPEAWQEHVDRVEATRDMTYLQLLKNRPGTKLCPQGIALRSVGETQRMYPLEV